MSIDTSTTSRTKVSLKNNYKDLSQIAITRTNDVGFVDAPNFNILVTVNNHDIHSIPNIWTKDVMVDFDLYPFDDVANQVTSTVKTLISVASRVGGKFQPKTRPKGKEGTSTSIPSKLPNVLKEETVILASMGSNATSIIHPDNIVSDCRSSQVMTSSQVAITNSLLSQVAVSNGCHDSHSSLRI
ncbi:hypothetical protein SCA6_017447 [Theobroma cacao]